MSRLESLLRVRARDIWDYEILYQCVGDSGDWSFKYARADESDPEIKTTFHGRRAFLTREAAEQRSEEHTSELQALMRISYAFLCLKKKRKRHDIKGRHHL